MKFLNLLNKSIFGVWCSITSKIFNEIEVKEKEKEKEKDIENVIIKMNKVDVIEREKEKKIENVIIKVEVKEEEIEREKEKDIEIEEKEIDNVVIKVEVKEVEEVIEKNVEIEEKGKENMEVKENKVLLNDKISLFNINHTYPIIGNLHFSDFNYLSFLLKDLFIK